MSMSEFVQYMNEIMIIKWEKMAAGLNLVRYTLIDDIDVLSGTNIRHIPRSMFASEFTLCILGIDYPILEFIF